MGMAYRTCELSKEQQQELKAAEQQASKASDLKRLIAVRLYGEGYRTQEIEVIVGCSWRSLKRWCADYQANGLAGVLDQRVGGNRAKLSDEQRVEVTTRLNSYHPDQLLPPTVRIEQGAFWTVSDLRIALDVWYDVTYQSDTSYRRLLHECGFSQQQTERQYRSRPSEEVITEFQARLEKKSPRSSNSMGQA